MAQNVTVTVTKRSVFGDRVIVTGVIGFPAGAGHLAAGDSLLLADLKLTKLESIIISSTLNVPGTAAALAVVTEPLVARGTNVVLTYDIAGAAVANTVDISAKKFRFLAIGS